MSPSVTDLTAEYSQTYSGRPTPWFIRLWAAVVRRAAVDYVLYKEHETTKLRKIGKDAEQWIFSDETDALSSFESVCDILDLDSSLVRSKIMKLGEEDARRLRGMEFGDDW